MSESASISDSADSKTIGGPNQLGCEAGSCIVSVASGKTGAAVRKKLVFQWEK